MKAARHALKDDGQPFSPAIGTASEALDGFLQFLGGAERDLLARLDLDRLAGRRVAAHARGALAHLQDAEAANADAVALLAVLDDEVDHVVEEQVGGILDELMCLGEFRRPSLPPFLALGNQSLSALGGLRRFDSTHRRIRTLCAAFVRLAGKRRSLRAASAMPTNFHSALRGRCPGSGFLSLVSPIFAT